VTTTPEQEIRMAAEMVRVGIKIQRPTIRRVGQIARSLGVKRGSKERYDLYPQRLLGELQKEKSDE
jgi:hypothetical protein